MLGRLVGLKPVTKQCKMVTTGVTLVKDLLQISYSHQILKILAAASKWLVKPLLWFRGGVYSPDSSVTCTAELPMDSLHTLSTLNDNFETKRLRACDR